MATSAPVSFTPEVFLLQFEVGNCCQSTITSKSISAELGKACGKAKKAITCCKKCMCNGSSSRGLSNWA